MTPPPTKMAEKATELGRKLDLLQEFIENNEADPRLGAVLEGWLGFLPIDQFNLSVELQVRYPLPHICRAYLALLDAGVSSAGELEEALGLDSPTEKRLRDFLSSTGRVSISTEPGYPITATELGLRELAQAFQTEAEREVIEFGFDPVSKRAVYYPFAQFYEPSILYQTRGTVELPESPVDYGPAFWGSAQILKEILNRVNRLAWDRNRKKEIVYESARVLNITDQQQWHRPVPVLLYRSEAENRFGLAVYDGWDFKAMNVEYSAFLTRLWEKGDIHLPNKGQKTKIRKNVPEIAQPAGGINQLLKDRIGQAKAAKSLPNQIEQVKTVIENICDGELPESLEGEYQKLFAEKNAELLAKEKELKDANAKLLGNAPPDERSDIQWLHTRQHRELLEQSFVDARHFVLVISPWMRLDAVNRYLVNRIEDALKRGVFIAFGYGISHKKDPLTEIVVSRLQSLSKYSNFLIKDVGDTHEKTLICDRNYVVTTSYNFLSYKPRPNEEIRVERGVLIRNRKKVEEKLPDVCARLGIDPSALP